MPIALALAASLLLLPVPEKVVEKLPSVIADVAPSAGGGAWLLARDDKYGDAQLWRVSAKGAAERVALPDPAGRRLQSIAASAAGDEVWVLSARAVLHADPKAGGAWTATAISLEADPRRALIVPLASGMAAWIVEPEEGGIRGGIVDRGAEVATFALACTLRGAHADGAGGLLLDGAAQLSPVRGWRGTHACGTAQGSGVSWSETAGSIPAKVLLARAPRAPAIPGGSDVAIAAPLSLPNTTGAPLDVWSWDGEAVKRDGADLFAIPVRTDGQRPRSVGAASAGDHAWVALHGYFRKKGVTLVGVSDAGVIATENVPFPKWWKTFLRREIVTLRESGGWLWAVQSHPGRASVLLRRSPNGKWTVFHGENVKERVRWLLEPSSSPTGGPAIDAVQKTSGCLAPVRKLFGG